MEKDLIVIVDKEDKKVGLEEKVKAHLGEGMLHRAFMVFVFNNQGNILLAQRSGEKMLWPLSWDCSCASHPKDGEAYVSAGERRLKEELGFSCSLELLDKFHYEAKYENIGAEKEVCATLAGRYFGEIKPNMKEVADLRWINPEEIRKDIAVNHQKYTPWLKIGLERFLKLEHKEI